jgi:hypothetical protein
MDAACATELPATAVSTISTKVLMVPSVDSGCRGVNNFATSTLTLSKLIYWDSPTHGASTAVGRRRRRAMSTTFCCSTWRLLSLEIESFGSLLPPIIVSECY